MSKITLYHNGPSTCSQKVRMILELKNINYESKIIDLLNGGQHDPEYVQLNPYHLVPTLVADGEVLIESSLINEYLEDAFPEVPARSSDPIKIHQMRLWAKYVDTYHPHCGAITYGIGMRNILLMKPKEELEIDLKNIPDPIKRSARRDLIEKGLDAPLVIEGIKQSRVFLDKLESELSTSEWLFNDSFGIADAAALPYIIRMEQLGLSELFNVSTRPNICAWYERIKAMEIFTKAVTDFIPDQLISVLSKFGEDQKDQVISIMEEN